MEISNIKINDIIPDPDQPRKSFDEEALDRLKKSIQDKGIESPIAVRENGKKFIIIDGERRWRASQGILNTIPCIVIEPDNVLEMQLRTDCLKEGLSVDELDRAIYRYYEHLETSFRVSKNTPKDQDNRLSHVSQKIGKSVPRVRKAIDRFEFKRDNKDFVKEIEHKHNPQNKPYSKVNSTIAMTDKLKETPEVRKAVVKKAVTLPQGIGKNEIIRKGVEAVANSGAKTAEEAEAVFNDVIIKSDLNTLMKTDPRIVLQEIRFKFNAVKLEFEQKNFNTPEVKAMLKNSKKLKEFIADVDDFLIQLMDLED